MGFVLTDEDHIFLRFGSAARRVDASTEESERSISIVDCSVTGFGYLGDEWKKRLDSIFWEIEIREARDNKTFGALYAERHRLYLNLDPAAFKEFWNSVLRSDGVYRVLQLWFRTPSAPTDPREVDRLEVVAVSLHESIAEQPNEKKRLVPQRLHPVVDELRTLTRSITRQLNSLSWTIQVALVFALILYWLVHSSAK